MFEETAQICQHHIAYLLRALLEERLSHGREPGGALPCPGAMQEQEWVQTWSQAPSESGEGGREDSQ